MSASPASSSTPRPRRWPHRLTLSSASFTGGLVASVVTSSSAYAAVPQPAGVQPPGTAGLVTMINWLAWIVGACGVVGILIVAGAMMIRHRRGESGESMGALGVVLGGCVLTAAAGGIAGALIGG